MRMTFLICNADGRHCGLVDDINEFLHFHTRGKFQVREADATEEKDSEDDPEPQSRTLLMVTFSDSTDALNFYEWRSISRRGRRS